MKLRVGLVGLGASWDTRNKPALRTLSDRFEVRAVYDQVSHRAEQAAHEFHAQAVDGYQSLVRRGDVDAILMLGPQWCGSLPVLAACDQGKAVYCATGFDFDEQDALRVRDRIEQAGIAFMAEFPRRHAPATIRLKELIATRLGRPRLVFCHHRAPVEPLPPGESRRRPPFSTANYLLELIDWCSYVVGSDPTSVIGLVHQSRSNSDHDYEMMSLDFSGSEGPGTGVVAQISCGRYMPATWPEAIAFRPPAALQVACEHGIAFIDLPATLIWFDRAGRQMESLEHERPVGEIMLNQFHRAVTSFVRKTCGFREAYRALAIVRQARASHAEGRRLFLDP